MISSIPYQVRFATTDDHDRLIPFYKTYYKEGHPLFNKQFWQWQYGSRPNARSIIAELTNGDIIGHMGCAEGGSIIWLINILIDKAYSGHGLTTALFDKARTLGPIAVAMANPAGQALLAKKKWYRYADLQRFVLINPSLTSAKKEVWVEPVCPNSEQLQKPTGHYWDQPGIDGIQLADGSNAVVQSAVGGLRMLDIIDVVTAAKNAWELGFHWMDHIASWNDPMVPMLQKLGWRDDSDMPWYLNPVDFNMKVVFNLFSEEPLPKDFLFHRSYADLGRTGKL
jgi:hypothetical protein